MLTTIAAPLTSNAKLGFGVATTYRPVGDSSKGEGTCSAKCPLLNNGCYAQKKLVNMQMNKARRKHDPLERLKEKGSTLVRLHTSGDFFNPEGLDKEYLNGVIDFAKENPKITIWTYCHDVPQLIAAGYSYENNSYPANLHILASVDSTEERNMVKEHGYKTARVLKSFDERIECEILCPYDKALHLKKKPTIKCSSCRLCFNDKFRQHDIAFMMH